MTKSRQRVQQKRKQQRSYRQRLQFFLNCSQNKRPVVLWDGKGGMLTNE